MSEKKPLTEAQLAQRRAASVLGGRPAKAVSAREIRRVAKERLAVKRAKGKAASVQEEVVDTLVLGMRGALPGSTAQSMIDAANSLARKGGLHDVQATIDLTDAPPKTFETGDAPTFAAPPGWTDAPPAAPTDAADDDDAEGSESPS